MKWYDAVGRSMMQYDENMQDKAAQLLGKINKTASQFNEQGWVIKFNGLMGIANIGVHIVHTSHVIITYTLESLSSLT